jgi:hypothetical protein
MAVRGCYPSPFLTRRFVTRVRSWSLRGTLHFIFSPQCAYPGLPAGDPGHCMAGDPGVYGVDGVVVYICVKRCRSHVLPKNCFCFISFMIIYSPLYRHRFHTTTSPFPPPRQRTAQLLAALSPASPTWQTCVAADRTPPAPPAALSECSACGSKRLCVDGPAAALKEKLAAACEPKRLCAERPAAEASVPASGSSSRR